ncbi:hypothetical protein [Endozoicomonas numazuensis]|uniref:Galactosyl transferase GMA12/MNN10 family protein n=1 Tax=Endozoicomonas numazuensis TaxID=1137799 RepID=A0A081NEM8_9GAMM|nr:hypothetical protein [Endozoicomonas numazuensis]KEQ16901.1 hypothetical protein GZ78_19825 [Endozoicomonas numazuensis]
MFKHLPDYLLVFIFGVFFTSLSGAAALERGMLYSGLYDDHKGFIKIISGGNGRPFVKGVKQNHKAYACFRNYAYRYFPIKGYEQELGELRPHWLKVLVIREELNSGTLQDGSWLIWLDDDLFIRDFEGPTSIFEKYIQTFSNLDTVLIATGDCDPFIMLNSGILIFKVGDRSREMVEEWWDSRPRQGNCHHDDQSRLIDLIQSGYEPYVAVVPQRLDNLSLNTFLLFFPSGGEDNDCYAQKGDFAMQPAGATEEDKEHILKQLLNQIYYFKIQYFQSACNL